MATQNSTETTDPRVPAWLVHQLSSVLSKMHCHAVGIGGSVGVLIRDQVLASDIDAAPMSPIEREGIIKGLDAAAEAVRDDIRRLGSLLGIDEEGTSGYWRYHHRPDAADAASVE